MSAPDFWNDQEKAQRVLKERARLGGPLETWEKLSKRIDRGS